MTLQVQIQLAYTDFSLDVDLDLPARGVTALFGPSGSGKTSLLRCIAGLERAPSARIEVSGEIWQDDARGIFVPTHQRALGYVFQEASLFPHLSVKRNLDFGAKRASGSSQPVDRAQICALLDIEHLLARMPASLSGGERQRVAIARALLARPRILLMDEPLSALDYARKKEILPYLERLHDDLEIPVLYVSHQPEEVAHLADYLVLLEQGRVTAHGELHTMLARIDLRGAFADRAGVVIDATVGAYDDKYKLTQLDFDGGSLLISSQKVPAVSRVRCRIHARNVSLALHPQNDSSILNRLPATVVAVAESSDPAQLLVRLDVGATPLLARITRRSSDTLGIKPGMQLWAQIKSVALLG